MTASPHEREGPPGFSIQLEDVFLHELRGWRREPEPDEPSEPRIDAAPVGAFIQEDRRGFSVRWRATIRYPAAPDEVVEVSCTVEGRFASPSDIDEDLYELFKARESFILLWPYLRASAGEVGRMMAVRLPPLPIVDVRSFLAAIDDAAREEESAELPGQE